MSLSDIVDRVERLLQYETEGRFPDGYEVDRAMMDDHLREQPITCEIAIMIVANRQGSLEQ